MPSPAPEDAEERVSTGGGEPLAPVNLPGAPLWLAYKGIRAGLQRTPAALPHFFSSCAGKSLPQTFTGNEETQAQPRP